jgi:hypothetical protein
MNTENLHGVQTIPREIAAPVASAVARCGKTVGVLIPQIPGNVISMNSQVDR